MNYISSFFGLIANIFRYHKLKIVFLIGSFVLCFVMLFPYSDLSDFFSSKISTISRNAINLRFDSIGFGLMPQLGVKMGNVSLDASMGSIKLSNVEFDSLGVAPNITQAIINNLRGKIKLADAIAMISKVSIGGIFGGDFSLYIAKSSKLGPQVPAVNIEVNADSLNLKELSGYAKTAFRTPFTGKGKVSLKSNMVLDPIFKEEPNGKYELSIKSLDIPSTNVPLNISGAQMSIGVPALKLTNVKLRGKLADKRFLVEEGKIGSGKDDLYGDITGEMILNIRPGGVLDPGGYNFVIDLNLKQSMIKQLGGMAAILDGFVGKFKNKTTDGVRYNFRVKDDPLSPTPKFLSPN